MNPMPLTIPWMTRLKSDDVSPACCGTRTKRAEPSNQHVRSQPGRLARPSAFEPHRSAEYRGHGQANRDAKDHIKRRQIREITSYAVRPTTHSTPNCSI